jgi:NAD-dependent deacetylase
MLSPRQCAEMISKAENIAILSGAGISTATGIPDFRGPKGLYVTRRYDPDKVFDIDAFHRDPKPFFEFTRDFIGVIDSIEPTFTHRFFAKLEASGKVTATITQNIDMLHQKAGVKNVIELHGSYYMSHCLKSGKPYPYPRMRELVLKMDVPKSESGGIIKPDIVFFGEEVKHLWDARAAAIACDLFFVLGSSLAVSPANTIPSFVNGIVVVVNKGSVNFEPGPDRHIVDDDLDAYFKETAKILEIDA